MPTVELRRISYNARLSEETPAYAAAIYIDGVKVGDCKNSGRGGETMVYVSAEARAQMLAFAATIAPITTSLPSRDGSEESFTYTITSVGSLCDHLLSESLRRRDFEKAVKAKIVYADAEGKIYVSRSRFPVKDMPQVIEAAVKQEAVKGAAGCRVLNALPFDEALAIWLASPV